MDQWEQQERVQLVKAQGSLGEASHGVQRTESSIGETTPLR